MMNMTMKILKRGLIILKTLEFKIIRKIAQYEKQTINPEDKP